MTRELEAEAQFYEERRASSRTLGCFAGCSTFLIPFGLGAFGVSTPYLMFATVGIGIFFMIRGLNARAKRDEAFRKLGAEKTQPGWRGAPTPQAYVAQDSWGQPPAPAAPMSVEGSAPAGSTPAAQPADAEQGYADDDKLAERLKKAKKTGF